MRNLGYNPGKNEISLTGCRPKADQVVQKHKQAEVLSFLFPPLALFEYMPLLWH
jgi:hypothetical protein